MLTLVAFGSDLYRDTLAFRDLHLRQPLGLPQSADDLEGEESQWHLAFIEHTTVQGTVVLKPAGEGVAKLRQMAVSPGLQGQGVGRRLVRYAEEVARERGITRIDLHARATAQRFYERLGYRSLGPAFIEVTVPHVAMTRDLRAG